MKARALWFITALSTVAHADEVATCVDAANSGQKLRDAGKLLEAKSMFQRCAASSCPTLVRQDCAGWFASADARIPKLTVRVRAKGQDVNDAQASLDGGPFALDGRSVAVDPGPHRLVVTLPTGERETLNVVMAEGEKDRVLEVSIEPSPKKQPEVRPAPAPQTSGTRVAGGVLLGAGALAFVVGGTLGALAYSEWTDLKKRCSPNLCEQSDVDPIKTRLVIVDSLLLSGALLGGAGAVLFFVLGKPSSAQVDAHGFKLNF